MLNRKAPVHQGAEIPWQIEIQFVTVCAKNRKPILANEAVRQQLIRSWARADDWVVGRYVVMPDHVHFFCSPRTYDARELKARVKHWKSHCASHWPNKVQLHVWQDGFLDTRMRNEEHYWAKWDYVFLNPVRVGFVEDPEEWPYAGEIISLT